MCHTEYAIQTPFAVNVVRYVVQIQGLFWSTALRDFRNSKKMTHKIYVGASNGAHKIVPKDKSVFSEIKYSKASLTIRLI